MSKTVYTEATEDDGIARIHVVTSEDGGWANDRYLTLDADLKLDGENIGSTSITCVDGDDAFAIIQAVMMKSYDGKPDHSMSLHIDDGLHQEDIVLDGMTIMSDVRIIHLRRTPVEEIVPSTTHD